jgi:hypothetical protein
MRVFDRVAVPAVAPSVQVSALWEARLSGWARSLAFGPAPVGDGRGTSGSSNMFHVRP